MANKIIIKNGSGTPNASVLDKAEFGFDTLNERVYIGRENDTPIAASELLINLEDSISGNAAPLNADSLGGITANFYATKEYVDEKIANGGGAAPDIDLSDLVTEERANQIASEVANNIANSVANRIVNDAIDNSINNLKLFVYQTIPPSDTKLLWIDTTENTGGLKYYNGSAWVHVPVSYT